MTARSICRGEPLDCVKDSLTGASVAFPYVIGRNCRQQQLTTTDTWEYTDTATEELITTDTREYTDQATDTAKEKTSW